MSIPTLQPGEYQNRQVKFQGSTLELAGLVVDGGDSGGLEGEILLQWPAGATVAAGTVYFSLKWPWTSGTVNRITTVTGGTGTPGAALDVQIGGVTVGGLGFVVVTTGIQSVDASAPNTITKGQTVTGVITGVTGVPTNCVMQLDVSHSNP